VIEEIFRKYLEIKSINDLNEVQIPSNNYSLNLIELKDFQLNKFFYKEIGKKCYWVDRLAWTDQNWVEYVSNKNLITYILQNNDNLVGYCEIILNREKQESKIAYFGILEEYFGKKLGGFFLSEIIKKSFLLNAKRVWVHTCSLDHKNALKNYLARGMEVFKSVIQKKEIA
jgi:ribosomal protein S18 acetylase RimI-like enzyme